MPAQTHHVGMLIASKIDGSLAQMSDQAGTDPDGDGDSDALNVSNGEPSMTDQWFSVSSVDTTDPNNILIGTGDGSIFKASITRVA